MRFRLSPATVIATAALFFALGGSALAISDAMRPQARCANGAVRGIVAVTGGAGGMANIPDQFSNNKALFTRTFTCTGGAPEVRRISRGVYEVRFPGNLAASATVSGSGAQSWLTPMPGGIFRVGLHVPGRADESESPFVVVAV
ncbi:MAG: hypothetical protein ABI927_05415 [Gaiellaceae bacterium]